jgi:hypothetical protein
MPDPAVTLHTYLISRFGISLEKALADATADITNLDLHREGVEIACDPVGRYSYDDDGISEQFQGLISVQGVIYRFRCSVFTDGGGARFVESIGELEIIRWGVRLVVPSRQGR